MPSSVCPVCGAEQLAAAELCSACGERFATSDPDDDCPLPVTAQNRNIFWFAFFWSVYYFAAPVSYVGLTHANLLKALGNSDTISNLPSAVYLWLTIVPVLMAWFFPQPKFLKPLSLISITLMAGMTALVAFTLWSGASTKVVSLMVIGHGAAFGAANGVLLTSMWDFLRRGVSTSRRGKALGFTFGIGPLFACVGSLMQDALFDGKLLGGHSFGLTFPNNYLAMFAGVAPVLMLAGMSVIFFAVPKPSNLQDETTNPVGEIVAGLKQFVANRNVLYAVIIYVVVYSGGNAIFSNVSLHAKDVLPGQADTLGLQSFLRFGFKAMTGALLGLLLAKANPRATLYATTTILLIGMGWALTSTGWPFMLTFGILGSGELFGAYFPNYVTTASRKNFVRVNMSYLSVLSAITGFASLAFGVISDQVGDYYESQTAGRYASFYAAAALLVIAMILITVLLPPNPTPREDDSPGL